MLAMLIGVNEKTQKMFLKEMKINLKNVFIISIK